MPVFRVLRRFWEADQSAKPMLAFLAASARDPSLRETTPFVLIIPPRSVVMAQETKSFLSERYPKRFNTVTGRATSQRIVSTWTQSGCLTGRAKKTRTRPDVSPIVAAYTFLLGYLCSVRGKLLLDTV